MARLPKPWFRKDRNCWFVTVSGLRHNLGRDKKQAFKRFHQLMQNPDCIRESLPELNTQSFAVVADSFLEWVRNNRAPDTFEWYRYRLERFCRFLPELGLFDLKPYHVQKWIDSYPTLSKSSKRNYVRSVKRCMKWALQQGYIDRDPIAAMECPGYNAREVCISLQEFEEFCGFVANHQFKELCRVTFETGCRPQEILRVEARHYDAKNSRWVMPIMESKGKRKPRIVYLTPYAKQVTDRLVMRYPSGKLFRNTNGVAWTTDAVNCAFTQIRRRMGRSLTNRKEVDRQVLASLPTGVELKNLSCHQRQNLRAKIWVVNVPRYSLYAFRHSWATRALQSGLDALTVAVLLGHNDPGTLARVYQHLAHNPDHLLKQLAFAGHQAENNVR